MSFGSITIGTDGAKYDSASEAEVASVLSDLKHEQVVAGYLPHPKVYGLDFDFLIQLGSESPDRGQIILLEYDGLGERRPDSLQQKMWRHLDLIEVGIDVRWLLGNSHAEVKKCLLDYEAPRVVTNQRECKCGNYEDVVVLTLRGTDDVPDVFSSTYSCLDCQKSNAATSR